MELVNNPAQVATMIQSHLDLMGVYHRLSVARDDRTAGNLYDADRAWCVERADIDSVLPAFVSAGLA